MFGFFFDLKEMVVIKKKTLEVLRVGVAVTMATILDFPYILCRCSF